MGSFYPEGTSPAEFLSEYAKHLDTAGVDSTFYRVPSKSIVKNWRDRTPPGFLFAAKVPRIITHDKVMDDCEPDPREFLSTTDLLGDKLGPLLPQFPYFNKQAFARGEDFNARLGPFLKRLPSGYSYALEIRNRNWISAELLALLRQHKIAFALIDQAWMPLINQLTEKYDVVTADFAYIRWLGDRKGIEEQTKRWGKSIVDREREMETWVHAIRQL